jgi:hypothetical protein
LDVLRAGLKQKEQDNNLRRPSNKENQPTVSFPGKKYAMRTIGGRP